MKLVCLLMLCAFVAAAPRVSKQPVFSVDIPEKVPDAERNILINILIQQLIRYVQNIINNGSDLFGIPPLDPLKLENFNFALETGLFNAKIDLEDALMTGIGAFVVNRSNLDLSELSFDLAINVPRLDISAVKYDFSGDLFGAIPLYGKGSARFEVENFRLGLKMYLTQSKDGQSVLVDRIDNLTFEIPYLKSSLTGVIGGGEIDGIVNAIIEEVVMGYVTRFEGAIASVISIAVPSIANPILEQLDTWRFLQPLLPSN